MNYKKNDLYFSKYEVLEYKKGFPVFVGYANNYKDIINIIKQKENKNININTIKYHFRKTTKNYYNNNELINKNSYDLILNKYYIYNTKNDYVEL